MWLLLSVLSHLKKNHTVDVYMCSQNMVMERTSGAKNRKQDYGVLGRRKEA